MSGSQTPDPSVYLYSDARSYLRDVLAARKARNPRYSVRAWAIRLGFKSPSLLLNILDGTRTISLPVGKRIATSLKLDPTESRYFDILVLLSRAKEELERQLLSEQLRRLRPDPRLTELTPAQFAEISSWYSLALLQLAECREFRLDFHALSRRLRDKASPDLLKAAYEKLVALGLISEDEGASRPTPKNFEVKGEIPSRSIRDWHRAILTLALPALDEQGIEERDYRSTVMAFRKEDYGAAKEIIRQFHQAMHRLAAKGASGDEVYALSSQFFKLSQGVA